MAFTTEQTALYRVLTAETFLDAKAQAEAANQSLLVTITNDPNPKKNGDYQYSSANGMVKLNSCGCKK